MKVASVNLSFFNFRWQKHKNMCCDVYLLYKWVTTGNISKLVWFSFFSNFIGLLIINIVWLSPHTADSARPCNPRFFFCLFFFGPVASPALASAVAALRRHQQVAAPVCSPSFLIWHSGMLQWPSDAVWQARQGSGCLCQSRSITPSSGRTTPSTCGKVTGCAQARPDEVSGEVSAATGTPLTGWLVSLPGEEKKTIQRKNLDGPLLVSGGTKWLKRGMFLPTLCVFLDSLVTGNMSKVLSSL